LEREGGGGGGEGELEEEEGVMGVEEEGSPALAWRRGLMYS